MVEQNSTRQHFLPIIATAKGADPYSDPKTMDSLAYKKDGAVEVYYSPFDHIAHRAKLVIVGITPGRAQARSTQLSQQELRFKAADQPKRPCAQQS